MQPNQTKLTLQRYALFFIVLLSCVFQSHAQDDSSQRVLQSFNSISTKSLRLIDNRYSILQKLIERKTEKMLKRMQKKEAVLQRQLQATDSIKSQQLFNSETKYQQLSSQLQSSANSGNSSSLKSYVPGIDSMQTSLQFLSMKGANIPGIPADKLAQIQALSARLQLLQGKLNTSAEAEDYIRQREQMLKDQLMQYGLGKQLLGVNKEVYYYQQQLAEYKDILNNKERMEETLLGAVRQVPAFQGFWQKYSILSQIFPMPSNLGTMAALDGLQTSAQLTSLIQQKLGMSNISGTSSTGSAIPDQYMQGAQGQIDQLKDKASNAGATNSNGTMPDFKPDAQHNKSFLKRLVFGFNTQSLPATALLPTITDIGLTLGVKVSDQIQAGVGASYKLGTGVLRCIHFSSEGASTRSYIDIRAKGNLWLTGGWEYNYIQSFKSLQELHKNVEVWQKSVLFGLTKRYSVGKKQGNIQLLYDVLAGQQIPKASPLKFRFGYSF